MHNFTQPQFNDYLEHMFEVSRMDDWHALPAKARFVFMRKMGASLQRCYGIDNLDAAKAVGAYLATVQEAAA